MLFGPLFEMSLTLLRACIFWCIFPFVYISDIVLHRASLKFFNIFNVVSHFSLFFHSWPRAERRRAYDCVRLPCVCQRQLTAHWPHEERSPRPPCVPSRTLHGKHSIASYWIAEGNLVIHCGLFCLSPYPFLYFLIHAFQLTRSLKAVRVVGVSRWGYLWIITLKGGARHT